MSDDERDLDPGGFEDLQAFRLLCHDALDMVIDEQTGKREQPVWRSVPDAVKEDLALPLPRTGTPIGQVLEDFTGQIAAYSLGNTHPAFWGWVHGSGTMTGMLASMLRGSMNANLGGREHAPVYVERQVLSWCKEMMGFPKTASGLLVSGTSSATLIGLAVARHKSLGATARMEGLRRKPQLLAYTSAEAHGSIGKAMELLGMGLAHLRKVPVDEAGAMDMKALAEMVEKDWRKPGHRPFAVIATIGSVNIGAIDDVGAIREICDAYGLWLHVDGAFGAAAMLAPSLRAKVEALSSADSLAFDFHKWLHVPYDAGCILVRDGNLHLETFSGRGDYLQSETRGAAAGEPWACDYGIELSRGFRALEVWMTLRHHGLDRLGAMVEKNCDQARYLAARVDVEPRLERLALVALNIVCLRYLPSDPSVAPDDIDTLNASLLVELHERGIAVPSSTRIGGALALRVCICNHRTRKGDLDRFVDAVLTIGQELCAEHEVICAL